MTDPEARPTPVHDWSDDVRVVHDQAERLFSWRYDRERSQLVTLYNKAAASQWNSVTDLDWAIDVDPERVITDEVPALRLARVAATLPGSPMARFGEREFTELGVELFKAQLSQFMHGEQGAMMTAAKLVETVPWIDAKYYAATQTMDEARHTEVFGRYLHEKIGAPYPMTPFLQGQIFGLLEDSRWDIAYLGMQIIIESLALAAFGDLLRRTSEPLLQKLLRYVMADEARHVAFGIVSLHEYYGGLTAAELKDRQEFLLDNTLRNRLRSVTPEVWEHMGLTMEQVLPNLHEAAGRVGAGPFQSFQQAFFSKLVPNVRKLGLLDANDGYLREKWAQAGLLQFEFAEDTASDFQSYDAVAADRVAASSASPGGRPLTP
jgi:hypothetical protein